MCSAIWIRETSSGLRRGLADVEDPHGGVLSALKLHYEVPTPDTYNGWWMKLRGADWSPYSEWKLVVRLGMGEVCTRTFKIELKTTEASKPQTYPYGVSITDRQFQAIQRDGFL